MGKRTKEWDNLRKKLVIQFQKAGILYCEIQFEGCWRHPDGFAHSKTRNNMGKWSTEERKTNLSEVVLACNHCHEKIEKKPFMTDLVREIIRNREFVNEFE